jgi:hypothetical protein
MMRIMIGLLGALLFLPAFAQQTKVAQRAVEAVITSKQFTFIARFIQPMSGTQVYLSGVDYSVSVTPDSVVCYLPYRGIAYAAPADLRDGGIKFTSKKFTYSTRMMKKGVGEVRIEPQDVRTVQWLQFSIAQGGNVYLQVMPSRAQQVSYSGELE